MRPCYYTRAQFSLVVGVNCCEINMFKNSTRVLLVLGFCAIRVTIHNKRLFKTEITRTRRVFNQTCMFIFGLLFYKQHISNLCDLQVRVDIAKTNVLLKTKLSKYY